MAITQVQSKQGELVSGTTGLALAFTSNVTAGNLLICRYSELNANARTPSVSDNVGGTWASLTITGANSRRTQTFYCLSAVGGATTVTITTGGLSDGFDMSIEEYSGGAGTWTLNNSDTSTGTTTTNHVCGATGFTTDANPSVLIGTDSLNASPGTVTPGSGYTQIAATTAASVWLYQITTGSITTQAPFTTSISRPECGQLSEFKFVASGGGARQQTLTLLGMGA